MFSHFFKYIVFLPNLPVCGLYCLLFCVSVLFCLCCSGVCVVLSVLFWGVCGQDRGVLSHVDVRGFTVTHNNHAGLLSPNKNMMTSRPNSQRDGVKKKGQEGFRKIRTITHKTTTITTERSETNNDDGSRRRGF